jgi:NYN domain
MGKLRFAWRMFWARRSRSRIALMCVLLAITGLAIIWLAIPQDWQRQTQNGVAFVARWVGALDTRTLLVALIGLCVVEAITLLFSPSYRKHGYLTTSPALIPPVSVYLDAENQHPERSIRPFMQYLRKRVRGQRVDLLFFQSTAYAVTIRDRIPDYNSNYRTLRLSGFQPIDVPHNPTGKNEISQAVDHEIAAHALERALLGPAKQLFIIVSGDGGYVPLIYRLVALGHCVQLWATKPPDAYYEVERLLNLDAKESTSVKGKYLSFEVVELAKAIPCLVLARRVLL